jgi:hypothetical protein
MEMNNAIAQLQLTNFTKFSELTIDFSPRVNVIIGENGTGKTHLLKAAYALCAGRSSLKNDAEIDDDDLNNAVSEKLLKVFMPLDNKLGNLRRHGAGNAGNAQMQARFATDKQIRLSFHTNSKAIVFQERAAYDQALPAPVFIPTKEVLSFMKGFNSLYEKYGLSFDQTYQIHLTVAGSPRGPSGTPCIEKSKWAMGDRKDICGGRFVSMAAVKVTFKTAECRILCQLHGRRLPQGGHTLASVGNRAIQPGIRAPCSGTSQNPT